MRLFQRILLVAVLTGLLLAAGIVGERFYLSPMVEQAARKPPEESPTTCPRRASMSWPNWRTAAPSRASPSASRLRRRNSRTKVRITRSANAPKLPTANRSRCRLRQACWSPIAMMLRDRSARRGRSTGCAGCSAVGRDARAAIPCRDVAGVGGRAFARRFVGSGAARGRARSDAAAGSDTEGERASARRELQLRGFSEVELELARQLVSPDAERASSLPALPRLGTSMPRRRWLTSDPRAGHLMAGSPPWPRPAIRRCWIAWRPWRRGTRTRRSRPWPSRSPGNGTWPRRGATFNRGGNDGQPLLRRFADHCRSRRPHRRRGPSSAPRHAGRAGQPSHALRRHGLGVRCRRPAHGPRGCRTGDRRPAASGPRSGRRADLGRGLAQRRSAEVARGKGDRVGRGPACAAGDPAGRGPARRERLGKTPPRGDRGLQAVRAQPADADRLAADVGRIPG